MIEGAQDTSNILEDVGIYSKSGTDIKGKATVFSVLQNLEERRTKAITGGINCIPLPFQRFRSEIPGIEQSQYIVITANQKTGKSQLADFLYVFTLLDYAFLHPSQCSVHIIYFSLEETVQRIMERYMSYLLFMLDGIRMAPTDLRSTSSANPVPEEILNKLNSPRYQERLAFFEQCVQFETEDTNPTGILRVCEAYAKSVGEYKSHKIASRGNAFKEVDVFDSYTPYDENHYKVCIIDHIGLVDKEQGFRTKDAVDKMSEYCVKYLRNRYGFTCVAIQQQASESEGLEAMKQKRTVPTAATLSDSKYTARDANLVLGLFDPSKFGQSSWLGYKIQDVDNTGLRNYARFMYVLANRDGEMGGICPLFFDGAVCTFEELPRPDDIAAITQYYLKAQNIKNSRQTKAVSALALWNFIKRIIKK